MKNFLFFLMFGSACLVILSCGPQAYVRGNYDENINRENLLNDQWSETDMQQAVKDLVSSAVIHPQLKHSRTPPVVIITQLKNKTSEHIDTQNIMDMMKVELMKTGSVQFVDKEARGDMKDEYDYQSSGMVERETQKSAGGQIGADFIFNGNLDSIVQQAGKDKTVYYKLTLNLTNLKTGLIVWSDYKQIRKIYKKQSVGF